MTTLDNLEIVPGTGLSFLKLGDSLYNILNLLKQNNIQMKLVYSKENPIRIPILVEVHHWKIRLMFNSSTQKLILIELLSFDSLVYRYKSSEINIKANLEIANPTLKQIYNKHFGPTYPGKLMDSNTYILSYPGVAFKFSLNDDIAHQIRDIDDNSKLSKLLNSKDIDCSAASLFTELSYEEFYSKLSKYLYNNEDYSFPSAGTFELNKVLIHLPSGQLKFVTNKDSFTVKLGETTQQQIISKLGPPEDSFNKNDSRLQIHEKIPHPITNGKFHNYFKFGIDLLYDLNDSSSASGRLIKVIIHNGVVDSMDFMRWNKCNWQMIGFDSSSDITTTSAILQDENKVFDNFHDYHPRATSNMLFHELPGNFKNDLNPVLLDRNESEFVDNELDIINRDELTNGDTTEQPSSNDEPISEAATTWGQTKLYGNKRCIWEVLNSNGSISSITMY